MNYFVLSQIINFNLDLYTMKTQIFFFLILTSLFCNGQTIPTDSLTGRFKYEQVIQAEVIKQADIYDRSKNWIVRSLKSSDNAINLDDSNKGSIIATGNILLNDQSGFLKYTNVVLNFKFSVYCKEGKYKIIVDNFILNYNVHLVGEIQPRTTPLEEGFKKEGVYKGKKQTDKTYIEVDEKIKKMILELKSSVTTGKVPGDKGDW